MIRPFVPLAAAVLAIQLLAPAAASAAEVQVDPILVELSPITRSETVSLRNVGSAPARFQVTLRGWDQARDGQMQLSPTEDVLTYPPVLTLAPGEARLIRVGLGPKGGFGANEKSYRLIVDELPPPEKPGQAAQVRVLSRLSIPVFLAPARSVERAALTLPSIMGAEARFALRNEGTAHLRASSVKLTARSGDGTLLSQLDLPAWYVLAGGDREYQATLPRERCAEVRTVEVISMLERGTVQAQAATPSGVCAPR